MQNKYIKFLFIILVIAFIVPQITLAAWWNPFSWGFWNSLFHRQNNTTQNQPQIIGGDKDAHGCLGSAGYSWCEVKNKCLRVWEEKCETNQAISVSKKQILGSWIREFVAEDSSMCPGGCPNGKDSYQIKFSINDDGQHIFQEWLHYRPNDSGTWSLNGNILTINSQEGIGIIEQKILKISEDILLLEQYGEYKKVK